MMGAMRLSEIAVATGGEMYGPDIEILSVTTDSRKVPNRALYVPLIGERFDGHDFIEQAFSAGAAACLTQSVPDSVDVRPVVSVDNTLRALGDVAALNRKAFQGTVIGLTGSCGKTSCKEMLASILSCAGNTLATSGNLNNEIGVPLTLLSLAPEQEYAVIEMGAAKAGDIAYLMQFVQPHIALITNAEAAHLAGFGSLDTVARTKGEIYRDLPGHGIAVINHDAPQSSLWQEFAADRRAVSVSLSSADVDYVVQNLQLKADGSEFTLRTPAGEVGIVLPLLGRAMVSNAALAAAAAHQAGASLENIRKGLALLQPVKGRLYPIKAASGYLLLDDSYNANPASVKAAIDVLAALHGRRILVLGDMAELGPDSNALHQQVGAYAAENNIDQLLVTGKFADSYKAGFGPETRVFADRSSLTGALTQQLKAGDSVLVKGSRSSAMDSIVEELCHKASGESAAC